jgi:hypothetical protein
MALQSFSVLRAQDVPDATKAVVEVVPKNWHKFPGGVPAGGYPPAYVRTNTWNGGIYGDDVAVAESNVLVDDRGLGDYGPRNQAEKAAALGVSFVTDITAPRGYIGPRDPYSKAIPAAPTITSLSPATAVAGSPDLIVQINGTGFTQWTKILNGGVQNVTAYFISPTKMAMAFEVSSSSAGITPVVAVDHGVASAASNFTFT